ncbi:unnamed protein product [Rangifer tarandus platyrhynchus]|uniref:Uncharacterized protein n=1 Tax=Rangifer tarandus platyrhynchus TaxID=3082113 RepID=A0AC59ZGB6_RANTA
MEMLSLSYVNELCVYPRLSLQVDLPKTQNLLDKPVCFTHANVFLSYVNETMYALGNLPFFKIRVNHFMDRDNSPCANVLPKGTLWVRGLCQSLSFETSPSLSSRLLVAI